MNYRVVNDRYELRRVIGTGSYSIVWEAWDRHLQRVDAIKFAKPLPNEDQVRPELLDEARRQGQISDKGIVTVYDVEEEHPHQDGPFIVMEYVSGQSLKARLAELVGNPMALSDAVAVAQGVLDALEAAHGVGIRHGDIKPSNILLGKDGVVKLCDFGAACSSDTLTRSSTVRTWFGTSLYQDPDMQSSGKPRNENDLYSLCLVIYEMLADRALPDLRQNGSLPDLVVLNPSVPPVFSAVIMAQLRPRLSERLPHCGTAVGLQKTLHKAVSEQDTPTVASEIPIVETRPFTVLPLASEQRGREQAGSATPALPPVRGEGPVRSRASEKRPPGGVGRFLSRIFGPAVELSPLAVAISEYYWTSAKMTESRRCLQIPTQLTVAVPGLDSAVWRATVISADRDAYRSVRARVRKELGPEWELVVPDLHLAILPRQDLAQAQVLDSDDAFHADGPITRVSIDETIRNASVLRLESRVAGGAFEIDAEKVVFPDLRFGTGRACLLRYRGPGQSRLDVEALQVISCDDRKVVCQVLDRRGMLLQRGSKGPVIHARAEIVCLEEGDVITFPGVKDYMQIVAA